jgi:hypothetical protein
MPPRIKLQYTCAPVPSVPEFSDAHLCPGKAIQKIGLRIEAAFFELGLEEVRKLQGAIPAFYALPKHE